MATRKDKENFNYILTYDDNNGLSNYISTAETLYDLITEFAEYTGDNSELFQKAISGISYNDIKSFVEMYNYFSNYSIRQIFKISKVIY